MAFKKAFVLTGLFAIATCAQQTKPSQPHSEPVLPYTPSLDLQPWIALPIPA
jgi:hypothetical protein